MIEDTIESLREELRIARNQIEAARSLLHEHYDDAVRIWNPKRGGWRRLRHDGAYVEADPPDVLLEYTAGWKDCWTAICKSLDGFMTETGCSASAAVEVMKSHIRRRSTAA